MSSAAVSWGTNGHHGVLPGRVALVTGAASNIGAATARAIAAAGGRVLATDLDPVGLDATAAQIRGVYGADAVATRVADLVDPDAARTLVEAAVAEHGRLDLVVHAAVDNTHGPIETLTPQMWNRVYAVNVAAVAWLVGAALPHLEQTGGTVVLFSSVQAQGGLADWSLYASTKGAVETLTKHLAVELGPRGIRVNAISPAWVTAQPDHDPTELPAYPLGRVGHPDEIASMVVYLASDAAAWITGSIIAVDGGMSALNPGQASRAAMRATPSRPWRARVKRFARQRRRGRVS